MALSVCSSLYAETILTGAVSNNHGEPLDYASVIASPCDAPKTILASAFTDETGHFRMSVKCDCDSLILIKSGNRAYSDRRSQSFRQL